MNNSSRDFYPPYTFIFVVKIPSKTTSLPAMLCTDEQQIQLMVTQLCLPPLVLHHHVVVSSFSSALLPAVPGHKKVAAKQS